MLAWLISKYVERQIKSALHAGNLDDLVTWLKVANQGTFELTHFNHCFSDNVSLTDYAFATSDQLLAQYKNSNLSFFEKLLPAHYRNQRRVLAYLLPSQSLVAINLKATAYQIPYQKKLSRWQTFLSNHVVHKESPQAAQAMGEDNFKLLLNRLRVKSENPATKTPPMDEKVVLDVRSTNQANLFTDPTELLKQQHLSNAEFLQKLTALSVPIPEEYSPNGLIDRPNLLKARMGMQLPSPNTLSQPSVMQEENNTVPAHMKHWLSTLAVVQQMNVNQVQEQEHQQEQKQEINLNTVATLEHKQEQIRYVDYSTVQKIEWKKGGTPTGIGAGLLRALREKLQVESVELLLSETAEAILRRCDHSMLSSFSSYNESGYITLDNLPLGFFVEEISGQTGPTFSLKYSEAYRKDQQKEEKHVLSLDPAAIDPTQVAWLLSCPKSISELIEQHSIRLNTTQKDFIEKICSDSILASTKFKYIIMESKSKHLFPHFIDQLMRLEKRRLPFDKFPGTTMLPENLLKLFCDFYLTYHMPDFTEVNPGLEKLATLPTEQLELFYLLSQTNMTAGYCTFKETWAALHCFISSLKDIPITTALIHNLATQHDRFNRSMFFTLSLVIDCINLSPLRAFQIDLLGELPKALGLATELLRKGYSFVHQSMQLEDKFFPEVNKMMLEKSFEELATIFKAIKREPTWADKPDAAITCRALYLRYIALYVNKQDAAQAYAQWEVIIGQSINADNPTELQGLLQQQWPSLQKYALYLSTRLDAPVRRIENAFANQIPAVAELAPNEKPYTEENINTLFSQLNLTNEFATALKNQIIRINELTLTYASYKTKEAFDQQLQIIREGFAQGDDVIAPALCLLRAAHYCHTQNMSTQNPQQGEWLRLEQLVTILTGVLSKTSYLFKNETSEGKTLIISFTALLEAMQGKKVRILTHAEPMATGAANHVRALADYLALPVATKQSPVGDILTYPIYCVDASIAIMDAKLAQFNPDKKMPGSRVNDVDLMDEVDNIAIDTLASTTMQISVATEIDAHYNNLLEPLIITLNDLIRNKLVHMPALITPNAQREFIQAELTKLTITLPEPFDLDYWIKAIVLAYTLKNRGHYVIEDNKIKIVHKDVTGRVDKRSEWGNGVHYCVTVWENSRGAKLTLPTVSQIIAEGDVASFSQNENKRLCYTGTLGSALEQATMQEVLGIKEQPLIMPRAKRPDPMHATWPRLPKVTVVEGKPTFSSQVIYNCSYGNPVIFMKDRNSHWFKLLEVLKIAHEKNFSFLVQFTTIDACEQFANFLRTYGLSKIQILDDKKEEVKDDTAPKFRPPESAVIACASEPQMITLTTAAGGRAIDFKGITLLLITSPMLGRIYHQQKDRVGRNGEFGAVIEMYCVEDLDQIAQVEWRGPIESVQNTVATASNNALSLIWHRFLEFFIQSDAPVYTIVSQRTILEKMQRRMEQIALDKISAEKPLRQLKHTMQEKIASQIKDCDPIQRKQRLSEWCVFFNAVHKERDLKQIEQQWQDYQMIKGATH